MPAILPLSLTPTKSLPPELLANADMLLAIFRESDIDFHVPLARLIPLYTPYHG